MHLPIIDFEPFLSGDTAARQATVEQIHSCCHEIGFMYLKNLGIAQNLVDQLFAQSQQFFALPLEIKEQLTHSQVITPSLRCAYVGIGREHEDPDQPDDLKEALDIFSHDGYYQESFVQSAIAPTTWSPVQQHLHQVALEFVDACTKASYQILQAFALSLQLPENYFETRHGRNNILRFLHYPSILQEPEPRQLRVGEHTDYGSITLLFQDETGGLEVCTVNGEWIGVPPIPGTTVVNIGDLMQQWTNEEFRSTQHRVVLPRQNVNNRYSVAFFCEPNDDTEIACLDSCQSKNHLPLYAPVLAGEHLRYRVQANIKPLSVPHSLHCTQTTTLKGEH